MQNFFNNNENCQPIKKTIFTASMSFNGFFKNSIESRFWSKPTGCNTTTKIVWKWTIAEKYVTWTTDTPVNLRDNSRPVLKLLEAVQRHKVSYFSRSHVYYSWCACEWALYLCSQYNCFTSWLWCRVYHLWLINVCQYWVNWIWLCTLRNK